MKRLLLSLMLLVASLASFAHDFEVDGIYYNVLSQGDLTCEVTYKGQTSTNADYSGDVDIPSQVTYNSVTYSVTSIGLCAFQRCASLTSIAIPSSVTSIGGCAFSECSSLTSVTIPNSVTSIGYSAFYQCSSLASITIPNSVSSIEDNVFFHCSNLSNITIPNSVTSIGGYAFSQCSALTSITIPESVTSIGNCAFWPGSKLSDVTLLATTPPSLGTSPFDTYGTLHVLAGCGAAYQAADNWKNFTIKEDMESGTCGENLTWILNTTTGTLTISGTGPMEDYDYRSNKPSWYSYRDVIRNVVVEEGVTSISHDAFSCYDDNTIYAIESVSLPESLTSIGEAAFHCCSSLSSINIPASVTTIESWVFGGCSSLTEIEIPNGVTSIGNSAFEGCSSLASITIPNSVTSIEQHAFYGCSSLASVIIPNSVAIIGYNAFSGCNALPVVDNIRYADTYLVEVVDKSLSSCNIKEGTRFIGSYAFRGCSYLTSFTVPESVTSIGDYAFYGHTSLASITIPNSVTCIGSNAFYGCSGLTSIIIPNSVTSIESSVFSGCTGLTSITIPESVTSIEGWAFRGCAGLTSISIPNSVTSIEQEAFYGCSSLTSITLPNSVTSIESGVFYGCRDLTSIIIPNSVTSIGNSAFSNCSGLTSITIPNSVTSIGQYAFQGCNNLSNVTCLATIPPALTSSSFYPLGTLHVLQGCGSAYKAAVYWRYFNIVEDVVLPKSITVGATGYTTYCSEDNLDFSEVEGLKAYIASSFNPNTGALILTHVTNVPAGEGVLLRGAAGETYDVPVTDETCVVANLIKGTTSTITLYPTDEDYTNFIMSQNNEGVVGFYRFNRNVTMPANKAWLQIPTRALGAGSPAQINAFIFDEDEDGDVITGIADIDQNSVNNDVVYDLQGRRLSGQPTHGLYIQNGKKIIMK